MKDVESEKSVKKITVGETKNNIKNYRHNSVHSGK